MTRKGIILAGGSGTRLYPITKVVSKQLMPVYDKPMIYYALSTLMLSDIRDVLVISTPNDINRFEELLGDGSKFGINIQYEIQKEPNGLPESFLIGKDFINNNLCTLILGDNICYGNALSSILLSASCKKNGASIFAYHVNDPSRYGVVEFSENKRIKTIEEKPKNPKSNFAITGLYYFDDNVHEIAQQIKPSERGELEIIDVIKAYHHVKTLDVEILPRGYTWLDTGTHASLLEASRFVSTIQNRQGLMVGCPEEIAYRKNWINADELLKIAQNYSNNRYGKYLNDLISIIE